jgi:hypothetical protein
MTGAALDERWRLGHTELAGLPTARGEDAPGHRSGQIGKLTFEPDAASLALHDRVRNGDG